MPLAIGIGISVTDGGAPAIAPPVNTVAPTITGTANVGQTLTTTNGTWTGSPSFTYQWKQDGSAIGGATSSTYVVASGDAGHTLTCTVTGTNAGGSASATSNGLAISSLLASLVAYYALDEASGTRVDATGRGNDLAAGTAPGNTTGKVANGGNFVSASSHFLTLADNADLSMGDIDFTVACWVKLGTAATTTQAFIGKWDDTTNNREWWIGCFSGRFNFGISSTGTNETFRQASTLGAPSTGTWYFVVGWHDSVANTLNIQINDGTVDSTSYSNGGRDGAMAVKMGAYRTTTFGFLNGVLDEVGVWKRVLTSGERTSLYNSGNGRTYPFTGT